MLSGAGCASEVVAPPATDAGPGAHWRADAACDGWCLPPLEQACDRVISCTVARCDDWGWRAAGARHVDCAGQLTSKPDLQQAVLLAADCTAVHSIVTGATLPIVTTCGLPSCARACARVAGCIISGCRGFASSMRQTLVSNCEASCSAQGAAWVFETSCAEQLAQMAESDSSFLPRCRGPSP
ncbi:MAG: hypothetical protein KC502_10030 [Myxococcales bacterium]|nr:hypothetical protein [Myxococcales bacterium]